MSVNCRSQRKDRTKSFYALFSVQALISLLCEVSQFRVVIPAKAGIQGVNRLFKTSFTAWTPAFAGVTKAKTATSHSRDIFLGGPSSTVPHRRQFSSPPPLRGRMKVGGPTEQETPPIPTFPLKGGRGRFTGLVGTWNTSRSRGNCNSHL